MSKLRLIIDHEHEAAHERLLLNEFAFWGYHSFKEVWHSVSCGQCGWGWNEVLHNGEYERWS